MSAPCSINRLSYIASVAPRHNAMVREIRAARLAREAAEQDAEIAFLKRAAKASFDGGDASVIVDYLADHDGVDADRQALWDAGIRW